MSYFNIIGTIAVFCAIAGFVAWLHAREKYSFVQQLQWLAIVYFIPIIGPIYFIWHQWNNRDATKP